MGWVFNEKQTTQESDDQANVADCLNQYDSRLDHGNLNREKLKIHIAEQSFHKFDTDVDYGYP